MEPALIIVDAQDRSLTKHSWHLVHSLTRLQYRYENVLLSHREGWGDSILVPAGHAVTKVRNGIEPDPTTRLWARQGPIHLCGISTGKAVLVAAALLNDEDAEVSVIQDHCADVDDRGSHNAALVLLRDILGTESVRNAKQISPPVKAHLQARDHRPRTITMGMKPDFRPADPEELAALEQIILSDTGPEHKRRAAGLLRIAQGESDADIAERLGMSKTQVGNWRRKAVRKPYPEVADGAPANGNTPKITDEISDQIYAMIEETPPSGKPRWTVTVLATEVMRREILDHVTPNAIRRHFNKRERQEGKPYPIARGRLYTTGPRERPDPLGEVGTSRFGKTD